MFGARVPIIVYVHVSRTPVGPLNASGSNLPGLEMGLSSSGMVLDLLI